MTLMYTILLIPGGELKVGATFEEVDRLISTQHSGWHSFNRAGTGNTGMVRVRLEAVIGFYGAN